MKVEILNSYSVKETQEKVNHFLLDNPIKLISMETKPYPVHDLFQSNGEICNQWVEYITTIIYE
mgnify:CR=1 FL=1